MTVSWWSPALRCRTPLWTLSRCLADREEPREQKVVKVVASHHHHLSTCSSGSLTPPSPFPLMAIIRSPGRRVPSTAAGPPRSTWIVVVTIVLSSQPLQSTLVMISNDYLYCYHYICFQYINYVTTSTETTFPTPTSFKATSTYTWTLSHQHFDLDHCEGSASKRNVMGAPTDNYSKCAVVLLQRHLVIQYHCDLKVSANNDGDSNDHLDDFRPSPGTWSYWGKAVLHF